MLLLIGKKNQINKLMLRRFMYGHRSDAVCSETEGTDNKRCSLATSNTNGDRATLFRKTVNPDDTNNARLCPLLHNA